MKALKFFISLVIGGVCLWLAFRGAASGQEGTGLSWREISAGIAAMPWWSHAGFAVLMVLQALVRTERWRVQVRGFTGTAPSWRDSLAINGVAYAAVFLMPFRLGEFVRPNLSAQRGIMRASAGLAASALERILDGIVTTGIFGVVLFWLGDRELPAWVRAGGVSALLVFGSAVLCLSIAFRYRAATAELVRRVLGRFHARLAERLTSMLLGFFDGLGCFKRPVDLVAYLGLSIAFWLLNGLGMLVLLRGLVPDVQLVDAFFCMCFLVIGVMLPAPPGNVGNFHAFARKSLTILGIAHGPAVAYAVLLHAWSTLGVVLWAMIFLLRRDVTLAGVRAAAHASQTPDGPAGAA